MFRFEPVLFGTQNIDSIDKKAFLSIANGIVYFKFVTI